jgi:hypothetical protein
MPDKYLDRLCENTILISFHTYPIHEVLTTKELLDMKNNIFKTLLHLLSNVECLLPQSQKE